MATHDYVIANGTGAAVRSDINDALAAIVSNNSNSTAPAQPYAYMWWADTTTGLLKIRDSANSAWVTVGTLASANLGLAPTSNPTFTGVTTNALGSAAAPSLTFTGDTNTGIYSPGSDQLAISTGGSGRLFVDASGNIGLGTSSFPYATGGRTCLDINGTSSSLINLKYGGVVGLTVGSSASANTFESNSTLPLVFYTNSSERLRITSAGLVGIGTTSPTEKLHVDGNILAGANGQIMTVSGSVQYGTRTANSVLFLQNNGEAARIDADKRLLVGTSSSSSPALFTVQGYQGSNTGEGIVYLQKGSTTPADGDAIGVLNFADSNGNRCAQVYAQRDGGTWTSGSSQPGRLVFSTTASGSASPTERIRITSGGFFKASDSGVYINATGQLHELVNSISGNEILATRHTASGNPYGISINFSGAAPNNTTNWFLQCSDTGGNRAFIRSNGGLANYSANNANLSDRNAKKDISLAADTWNCLKEWEIVNYRYKDQPDDADLNLGVIAQQVAESCPEVITVFQEATEDEPEKLGVKEQQMYWMAIKALQEAQVRIEALEAEVAALKAS